MSGQHIGHRFSTVQPKNTYRVAGNGVDRVFRVIITIHHLHGRRIVHRNPDWIILSGYKRATFSDAV